MHWYPLKLTTPIRAYTFGERLIPEHLGKRGLPDGTIAETWEVSGYRDAMGTVINGSFKGRTLQDLTLTYPDELVGQGWRGPYFPLLAKFIDASHMLPVHLHADNETAARLHNEPNGKTEAWHILWAAPGATVLAGLKSDFTREQLFEAFIAQDYDAVMVRHPIRTGDTIYVPGGIIHSFGPDALVFEIQQTSDLGQFVMPSDIYGRQLSQEEWHAGINATLAELRNTYQPRPIAGLKLQDGDNYRVINGAGPYFALEHWTLSQTHIEPSHPNRLLTLSCVEGAVQLEFSGGTEPLKLGESCILPAAIGQVRIVQEQQASLVACYVPNLQIDIVEPLRKAGYNDQQIQDLGEISL